MHPTKHSRISASLFDNGQLLRLINGHLPGDPTKPGRFEFAQYLAKTFDPTVTTLAMGDMNFDELEMSGAMSRAFHNHSPFSLYSPYCTNISPYVFKSKAIDHFLVYSPNQSSVVLSTPDEIMPGLAHLVALLQGSDRPTTDLSRREWLIARSCSLKSDSQSKYPWFKMAKTRKSTPATLTLKAIPGF